MEIIKLTEPDTARFTSMYMNNKNEIWKLSKGKGPIVAAAIHDGHLLREEVAEIINLRDSIRLMEEDPFTGI
jgi:hypothetical protein